MAMQPAVATRNRAILGIRAGTVAAILGSIGLTWLFAILAEDFFSGKPPEPPPVPQVPQQAAPVQVPPKVITTVVHKVGYPPGTTGPRPPSSAPGAAPAPAPPPACHSTPSKPC